MLMQQYFISPIFIVHLRAFQNFTFRFIDTNMYKISNHTACLPFEDYIAGYRDKNKFIEFCKQCRQYGNCWVCPPYDFDMEQYLSGFEIVYVIGTKITPGEEARSKFNTPEKAQEAGREMLAEVRKIIDPKLLELEKQYPDSKAFFAGTCFQCTEGECTRKKGKPCIHPGRVRPSLEAFGFDIGKTASDLLHIDLKWSKDGSLPEYFTLVSGFLTNDPAAFVVI